MFAPSAHASRNQLRLIFETTKDVRLLDEETLVFHPLENTASVAMRGEDFFGTFLRAVCKTYTPVDMERKEETDA